MLDAITNNDHTFKNINKSKKYKRNKEVEICVTNIQYKKGYKYDEDGKYLYTKADEGNGKLSSDNRYYNPSFNDGQSKNRIYNNRYKNNENISIDEHYLYVLLVTGKPYEWKYAYIKYVVQYYQGVITKKEMNEVDINGLKYGEFMKSFILEWSLLFRHIFNTYLLPVSHPMFNLKDTNGITFYQYLNTRELDWSELYFSVYDQYKHNFCTWNIKFFQRQDICGCTMWQYNRYFQITNRILINRHTNKITYPQIKNQYIFDDICDRYKNKPKQVISNATPNLSIKNNDCVLNSKISNLVNTLDYAANDGKATMQKSTFIMHNCNESPFIISKNVVEDVEESFEEYFNKYVKKDYAENIKKNVDKILSPKKPGKSGTKSAFENFDKLFTVTITGTTTKSYQHLETEMINHFNYWRKLGKISTLNSLSDVYVIEHNENVTYLHAIVRYYGLGRNGNAIKLSNHSKNIKKGVRDNICDDGITISSKSTLIKSETILNDVIKIYKTYGELIVHKTHQRSSGDLISVKGEIDDLHKSQILKF